MSPLTKQHPVPSIFFYGRTISCTTISSAWLRMLFIALTHAILSYSLSSSSTFSDSCICLIISCNLFCIWSFKSARYVQSLSGQNQIVEYYRILLFNIIPVYTTIFPNMSLFLQKFQYQNIVISNNLIYNTIFCDFVFHIRDLDSWFLRHIEIHWCSNTTCKPKNHWYYWTLRNVYTYCRNN